MLLIHVFSPDPDVSAFPAACPPGKGFGCSRIAESDPHHTRHLKPLHLNTTLGAASAAAADWVEQQAQSKILLRRDDLIHARFITFFWGFADDMFVGLRCEDEGRCVVGTAGPRVQGQSKGGGCSTRPLIAGAAAARHHPEPFLLPALNLSCTGAGPGPGSGIRNQQDVCWSQNLIPWLVPHLCIATTQVQRAAAGGGGGAGAAAAGQERPGGQWAAEPALHAGP